MGSDRVVKSVRMSRELVARVEGVRGDVVWSTWVVRAVEQRLEREGGGAASHVEAHGDFGSAARRVRPPAGSGHAVSCGCPVCKAGE